MLPVTMRLALALAAFVLLVLANLAQHVWHPPLSLAEEQAAKDWGGPDWRVRFNPYDLTRGERLWTPAHEARLQDYVGKGVYLTAITIMGQCVYQGLSLLVEVGLAFGRPLPRLTTAVYSSAAFINGLGVMMCCMFLFFWAIQKAVHPEWRAQWNFYEARGYPKYWPLMVLVHLPSLVCGFVDVASKDASLLAKYLPGPAALVWAGTAYHVAYEAWLYLNFVMCGGAIPYPWYYDIQLSDRPLTNLLLYLVVVNAMISGIVLGYRRYIIACVGSAVATQRPTKRATKRE